MAKLEKKRSGLNNINTQVLVRSVTTKEVNKLRRYSKYVTRIAQITTPVAGRNAEESRTRDEVGKTMKRAKLEGVNNGNAQMTRSMKTEAQILHESKNEATANTGTP